MNTLPKLEWQRAEIIIETNQGQYTVPAQRCGSLAVVNCSIDFRGTKRKWKSLTHVPSGMLLAGMTFSPHQTVSQLYELAEKMFSALPEEDERWVCDLRQPARCAVLARILRPIVFGEQT